MTKTELKALQNGMQLKTGGIYVIHIGNNEANEGLKIIAQELNIHFILLRPHQKVSELPLDQLKHIIKYIESKPVEKAE